MLLNTVLYFLSSFYVFFLFSSKGKFPTTPKSPQETIHEPEDENNNESQDGVDSSDEEVFSDDANERQESDDEDNGSDNEDLLKSKKYGITYGKQTK